MILSRGAAIVAAALLLADVARADPCVLFPTTTLSVIRYPNPIVEAWRLCQKQEVAEGNGEACAKIEKRYAETGIAAREKAAAEKAAEDYRACASRYVRDVASPDYKPFDSVPPTLIGSGGITVPLTGPR